MLKLIYLLVVCSISLSDACKCARPEGWEKTTYCDSKFAAVIEVTSKVRDCETNRHCYTIKVVDQIRGHSISPTTLSTASDSAACGVTLIKGHTYFVVADPNGNTINLNSCQLYIDWTGLSPSELKKHKQEYERISCGDKPCDKPTEPEPDTDDCLVDKLLQLLDKVFSELMKWIKQLDLRSCGSCRDD